MKILFVNQSGGYLGGVEQHVLNMAKALGGRGHVCCLAYGDRTEKSFTDYMSHFSDSRPVRELCSDGSVPSAEHRLFSDIVRELAPDAIYIHKAPSIRTLGLPSLGVRAIRMIHDYDVTCPRGRKYYTVGQKICRHQADWRCWVDLAFLKKDPQSPVGIGFASIPDRMEEMRAHRILDRILVVSHAMENEMLMNGFTSEQVSVLPPAVRLSDRPITPPSESRHILYVGQLIRGKGVDLMLRALGRVRTDFSATLIGTGNAQKDLEKLCRTLGLQDRIRFLGWVANDEIGKFYEDSRMVVVPSRWPDPLPTVVLEAMRHARAVVAFDVGGIPEMVDRDKTGFLAKEQDIDGMADAIRKLLEDRALAGAMGRKGYERARDEFVTERYFSALEGHLRCA